jgi:hypothetical protein
MKAEANNSKRIIRIVKYSIIAALMAVVANYVMRVTFSIAKIDGGKYGRYFYVWRRMSADNLMINGRYKFIKKNTQPDTEEFREFLRLAQEGKDAYYLKTGLPDHFPREFNFQHSLYFSGLEDFLKMRDNYIFASDATLNRKELEDNIEDTIKKAKESGKSGKSFFLPLPRRMSAMRVINDVLFKGMEKSGWRDVAVKLREGLADLLDEKKTKKKYSVGNDGKPNDALVGDIITCLKDVGVRDKYCKAEVVENFFVDNGRVRAKPYYTYAYSRAYYLFYFLTGGVEFKADKGKDLSAMDEKEKNEYAKERMDYVARMFTHAMANLYPNGYKEPEKHSFLSWKWIRAHYSPTSALKKKDEEPLDKSDIETVVGALGAR